MCCRPLKNNANNKKGNKKRKGMLTVIVLRFDGGALKGSKPCMHCIHKMTAAGVHRVIWSTGDSKRPFQSELIAHVSNSWISRNNSYERRSQSTGKCK